MSNSITLQNQTNSFMSSKEIAELTNKLHSHVLRDIRAMIEQLDNPKMDGFDFVTNFRKDNGQTESISLNHDLTMLLLTGYDVKARLKVIQRWKELEAQQAQKLPQTFAEALRLAAEQAEQIEKQQALISYQTPKVQALEIIEHSEGSKSITDSAKILDVKPKQLFDMLQRIKWIFKRNEKDSWNAYQTTIEVGYMEMTARTTHNTGEAVLRKQAMITPKGIAKLAEMIAREKVTALLS